MLGLLAFRAFVIEPFNIPAGSMVPTLMVGDYIFVSKSAYGLRLPESDSRLAGQSQPERGDVAVFRYPENPKVHYVKRVVGLPGDTVDYHDKRLTINGQAVQRTADGQQNAVGNAFYNMLRYKETLGGHTYTIPINPQAPAVQLARVRQFPSLERCEYDDDGFRCVVPAAHYFVMGDNRDSSSDSHYWGFLPDANLVGRATLIWCSQRRPERIGLKIE